MGSNKNEKRKPKSAVYRSFWASVVYFHLRLISTKNHKGEMTRNQVVLTGSWVRIPPLPPQSPVNSRVCWTFLFSARTDFTHRKRSKSAHFRLDFARLQEQGLPEKPYISSLFGVCLGFLQELHLPSLALGIRQNKNIVHYIRRSYLGFIIQMAVNIRCCADIAVTEPLLNLLHRYIVCKK